MESYVNACSDGIGVYSVVYFLPFVFPLWRFGTETTGVGD
jgi:hypothetical protein